MLSSFLPILHCFYLLYVALFCLFGLCLSSETLLSCLMNSSLQARFNVKVLRSSECGKTHRWQPYDGDSAILSAPFHLSPFRGTHSWVHTRPLPPLCFQMHSVTSRPAPQKVKLPFPISEENRSSNCPVFQPLSCLLRHQVLALPAEPFWVL